MGVTASPVKEEGRERRKKRRKRKRKEKEEGEKGGREELNWPTCVSGGQRILPAKLPFSRLKIPTPKISKI
jgi:hypothetical protein